MFTACNGSAFNAANAINNLCGSIVFNLNAEKKALRTPLKTHTICQYK